MNKAAHHTLAGLVFLSQCALATAADVNLNGIVGTKALVVIDGGKPRWLNVGETSSDGIKLISIGGDTAVLESGGQRQTLKLGHSERLAVGTTPTGSSGKSVTLIADGRGHFVTTGSLVNLPAVLIVAIVTAVLVKGIQESARFNTARVIVKLLAVLFVIGVGAFYINSANWTPFAPYGWSGLSFFGQPILGEPQNGRPVGVLAGAAIIFFAYIGFDSVSTHAEEAKNPQRDVPIAIVTSLLICTVLYIAVVAVLTGMVRYNEIDIHAGVSDAFKKAGLPKAEFIIAGAGVAGITSVLLVMMLSAPRVFLAMARDGLVPSRFFADVHPRFQTPWKSTILIGVFVGVLAGLLPIDALLDLTNIGTLFAFVIVCGAVLIMRKTNPDTPRPFRCPFVPVVPVLGIAACLMLMFSLPAENWYRLIGWLAIGMCIYFGYGRKHSILGQQLRGELARHGATPAGSLKDGPQP